MFVAIYMVGLILNLHGVAAFTFAPASIVSSTRRNEAPPCYFPTIRHHRLNTCSSESTTLNHRHIHVLFSTSIDEPEPNKPLSTFLDYLKAIRPTTCLQAIGALVIGYLALISGHSNTIPSSPLQQLGNPHLLAASTSVYLSYSAGMLMHDVVDVYTDSLHVTKSDRAIASGRISAKAGWTYCAALSIASLILGWYIGPQYGIWTLSNLGIMLGYALGGLQRVFLVKNVLCGWLAISPLIGAAILATSACSSGTIMASGDSITSSSKLIRLAAVGFPMHLAREIVKDIEDMAIDRGNKSTLPLVVGKRIAHRIAYGIVGCVCSVMVFTPLYWGMFASRYHIYPLGVAVGLPMCIRASFLPLSEGQRLLKKSIYVLLAGMIGGLLAQ